MIELVHEFVDENGRARSVRQSMKRLVDRRKYVLEDDTEIDVFDLYGHGEKLFFFSAKNVLDTINLLRTDLTVAATPATIFYIPQGGSVFVPLDPGVYVAADPESGQGRLTWSRSNVNKDWEIEMMVFE